MKSAWVVLKGTIQKFTADPVLRLSAATAYYAIFSIAPLLVLAAGLAGLVFGEAKVQQEVGRQLTSFIGPQATHMVQSMMNAQFKGGSTLAVIVGGAALILGAVSAFSQLQDSLNTIWGVKAKPGQGIWLFVRDRVLSLAMILAVGFLLLVSMTLTTVVNAFTHYIGRATSLPDWLAPFFDGLVSFIVIAVLFSLIFKVLPDVKIRWRDVWVGGIGTAALFSAGKYLLGLYLSHETGVSAYGAGSAFVVILLYVYYASLILYFGAEFTAVYSRHRGAKIEPSKYAAPAGFSQQAKAAPVKNSTDHGPHEPESRDTPAPPLEHIRRGFWRRLGSRAALVVPAVGIVLVTLRLSLPYIVRDYVNHTIKHVQDYNGSVKDVRINLYRGAYTIQNLVLVKTNAQTQEPFLIIPEMDLSVEWKQLIHGAVVGKVVVDGPRVNFENGPSPQQQQIGMHKNWKQTLEKLFPITINRFQVNNGAIHYADPHQNPPVDMWVTNLSAAATNLTNVQNKKNTLPAGLIASGKTVGNGTLHIELHMDPLAHAPTFKLIASLTNMDLTALNNFMRAYGKFDVKRGTFGLYLDVAAAHEKYQGYFKPFFFDLQVFNWQEAKHENILHDFWEAIVAGISHVLRNQPENQLATVVPISGQFQSGSNIDLWTTIGGILQNAFVRALLPKINHPTTPLPPPGNLPPTGGSTPRKKTQKATPPLAINSSPDPRFPAHRKESNFLEKYAAAFLACGICAGQKWT